MKKKSASSKSRKVVSKTTLNKRLAKYKAQADKMYQKYVDALPEPRRSVTKILGIYGRMISFSKSWYGEHHPQHVTVFNSNLIAVEDKKKAKANNRQPVTKLWYGDLDLTVDEPKLVELSAKLQLDLYVLREMDGRFENEEEPKIDRYVLRVTRPNDGNGGMVVVGQSLIAYTERIKSGELANKLVYRKDFR